MMELVKELDGKILDIGGGGEGVIGRLYTSQVVAIDNNQAELDEAPGGFYLRRASVRTDSICAFKSNWTVRFCGGGRFYATCQKTTPHFLQNRQLKPGVCHGIIVLNSTCCICSVQKFFKED